MGLGAAGAHMIAMGPSNSPSVEVYAPRPLGRLCPGWGSQTQANITMHCHLHQDTHWGVKDHRAGPPLVGPLHVSGSRSRIPVCSFCADSSGLKQLFNRNVAYRRSAAVALRAHQTQEFGGVNLANIAEKLGYSDDPLAGATPRARRRN
jgi:hypothetical protein